MDKYSTQPPKRVCLRRRIRTMSSVSEITPIQDGESEVLPPEPESEEEEEIVWPWESDIPSIHEFRLSVQSLLRGSDREMLEVASEVLSGIQGTMSKAWAIEVMKEIFGRFGLEFRHAMYDEVATPRWSMIDLSEGAQPSQEEDQPDDH